MPRFEGRELDALLLDLDDTLLDNRTGLRQAWERVADLLAERDTSLDREGVREQIRSSTRWFWSDDARHRSGRLDLPRARLEILSHVLESLGRPDAELAQEAAHAYTELRDRSLAPLPGAFRALERLRRRVPGLGLITNGAAQAQRAKIERFDLARHFDVVVIEGEFGAGKPDVRVFAHALERLGASAEQALMVGDNYECDVLGALEAGLSAAWIDVEGSSTPPASPPRPHAIVRSVVEVCERLEG